MTMDTITPRDRAMARICEYCPACMHARHHQKGIVFQLVKKVEERICPFCRAYERVHGRRAHERRP